MPRTTPIFALLLAWAAAPAFAAGTDRDIDNDGMWDYERDLEDGSVDF